VNAVTVSAAGTLCTPPSCFREGLALAWNGTRSGLGAGAAVVDPTPCTSRRKRGTDRHHLPGRHPEPCLPHGVAWPDPKAPGARRSVRRSRAPGRPRYLPQRGETGQARGLDTTVPGAAPEGMGRTTPSARDTCQPANRAPPGTREALVGRRGSPVASLALGRVIGQWAIAPGTEVEAHSAALPLGLARYVLRIVLEVGS
jgi:hypothetical protein